MRGWREWNGKIYYEKVGNGRRLKSGPQKVVPVSERVVAKKLVKIEFLTRGTSLEQLLKIFSKNSP